MLWMLPSQAGRCRVRLAALALSLALDPAASSEAPEQLRQPHSSPPAPLATVVLAALDSSPVPCRVRPSTRHRVH